MDLCRCETCFVSLKNDMLQDEHVGNSKETGGNQRLWLREANHRWFLCRERCWHRYGQADGYGWILIGGCLESFLYEKNHGYTQIRIKYVVDRNIRYMYVLCMYINVILGMLPVNIICQGSPSCTERLNIFTTHSTSLSQNNHPKRQGKLQNFNFWDHSPIGVLASWGVMQFRCYSNLIIFEKG